MTAIPKLVPAAAGTPLNVLGDQVLVKLTGQDTNAQFALTEQVNKPGTGLPLHLHTQEDETFLVLEGQVEFVIGADSSIVEAGGLAYAPRGTAHSFRVVGDTPVRMLIHISPAGLENMFQELSQLPADPPDVAQVAAICGRYGVSFV
ncbi:cupin domain-containing protein [Hymenobacter cellulosivorans]|uniref:Cupin domain-containing protein n=1 Tax=Hymenobacter cellulosivorans TaxID=2932249 RepID=A0ABY4F5A4_9BACT|nr:cupin domain-containing protein [Hymenobacter cellulosivorans]UOQ51750.1 cupin domain-containing protein [Hymenobacter cellulosivorans]